MTVLCTVNAKEERGKNWSIGFHIQPAEVLPQCFSRLGVNKEATEQETKGSQDGCETRLCQVHLHENRGLW